LIGRDFLADASHTQERSQRTGNDNRLIICPIGNVGTRTGVRIIERAQMKRVKKSKTKTRKSEGLVTREPHTDTPFEASALDGR